ncbi:methionyl-tRNA formyltransferase [Pelagibius sp. Alg239-R121]|uniref:methionyl-tRNA formyltransferase n=1 Tax=Pelagibius sp. Alg239-R121 TaxID=2993448 RepID=UPI0024A6808B|nr:formyltransferase family protein [Pelagibius sp. Alg239-R121]
MTPRWAFAGCKPQAIEVLTALKDRGFVPVFAACMPEAPDQDRHDLQAWCSGHGVECVTSSDLKSVTGRLRELDLLLVCRFNLLDHEVFDAPRLGAINVHSSLLPAYRGVHPVSWALINDERETGVTLHRIDPGVDTGGILATQAIPIEERHDLWSLTEDLDRLSARLAVEVFDFLSVKGKLPEVRQQTGPGSYAPRRSADDGRIDWSVSARSLFNLIRALPAPLPSAFAKRPDGGEIRIRQASLNDRHPVSDAVPGQILTCNGEGWFDVACGDGTALKCQADLPVSVGERLS